MTSTKLIGRPTMEFRLLEFHKQRIERAFPFMNQKDKEEKYMIIKENYKSMSTAKMCKDYDSTFGEIENPPNDKMEIASTIQSYDF